MEEMAAPVVDSGAAVHVIANRPGARRRRRAAPRPPLRALAAADARRVHHDLLGRVLPVGARSARRSDEQRDDDRVPGAGGLEAERREGRHPGASARVSAAWEWHLDDEPASSCLVLGAPAPRRCSRRAGSCSPASSTTDGDAGRRPGGRGLRRPGRDRRRARRCGEGGAVSGRHPRRHVTGGTDRVHGDAEGGAAAGRPPVGP